MDFDIGPKKYAKLKPPKKVRENKIIPIMASTNESSPAFSRLSRPGSGRGAEQYNAWDRSNRPGSGRGGAGNHNSASPMNSVRIFTK